MKKPKTPPPSDLRMRLFNNANQDRVNKILKIAHAESRTQKYRHWDVLRHITPPDDLSSEEWWYGIKVIRFSEMRPLPLLDKAGNSFSYNIPDSIIASLHEIDLGAGGIIGTDLSVINSSTKRQYIMRSLIQESITSSQLEGAATTIKVAKEMLRTGRAARDKSERMIENNFNTMQRILEWKDQKLDENLIFQIHREITDGTLDQPNAAGRLRKSNENVVVEDWSTKEILHEPPDASELPKRLKALCDFANGKTPDYFIHPVLRAIILHFWLAYDHPFIDGNGRVARALFYWLMLRNGYWLFEYISISEIILNAPAKYVRAFLYTETDDNDLTYFIIHQTNVITQALKKLHNYIEDKSNKVLELEQLLHGYRRFNYRQEGLLAHALRNHRTNYTVEGHKNSYQISYETARKDLHELQNLGLLEQRKVSKAFIYIAPEDLEHRIKSLQ